MLSFLSPFSFTYSFSPPHLCGLCAKDPSNPRDFIMKGRNKAPFSVPPSFSSSTFCVANVTTPRILPCLSLYRPFLFLRGTDSQLLLGLPSVHRAGVFIMIVFKDFSFLSTQGCGYCRKQEEREREKGKKDREGREEEEEEQEREREKLSCWRTFAEAAFNTLTPPLLPFPPSLLKHTSPFSAL